MKHGAALLLPGQVMVFEGDSLTRRSMPPSMDNWPLLRMNQWDRSWADLVEEWVFAHRPDLQIKCRHAAVGGSTITGMESRYESCVKLHRPSWILFTLGTNDCTQKIGVKNFRNRLAAYIQTAHSDSAARFLYAGGFLPMPGLTAADVEKVNQAREYYDAAREAVIASGGIAVDVGLAMQKKAELHFAASTYHSFYADGTHLNALGNHVLAGLVMEMLGVFAYSSFGPDSPSKHPEPGK